MDFKFFEHLYQFCESGFIELRAFPSKHRDFFNLDPLDKEGMEEFCKRHRSENLFFGVALRETTRDGTKENLWQIPAVWCDVDFKETPREILAEKFKRFPYKPAITVKSGGGVHFYWLLKEPAEKADIEIVEDVNKRIAAALSGDFNACDASRILRIPDTLNVKYTPPRKCEVSEYNSFTYELDSFLSILPPPQPARAAAKGKAGDDTGDEKEWLDEALMGCNTGNRNSTGTKIAGYYINRLSPAATMQILKLWNDRNTPPLPQAELQTIINSVSRYKPESAKNPRVDIAHVYDAGRMIEEYKKYVAGLKNNRFLTGINQIDKLIRGVGSGEVMTIIARAGSFKTALLQNMLKSYVKSSEFAAVFFSIEMPVHSVTERSIQMGGRMSGYEVERIFSSQDSQVEVIETVFRDDLKNIFVVPVKVSLSDIGAYIQLIQNEHNVRIGVIGIDYMGLIDSPGNNEYEILSRVAREAKDAAKLMNLPVVILSQISRKGGDGEIEVSLDMARGSGAIEEAADFILGLWQAKRDETASDDNAEYDLICRILKNRKGPKGSRWTLDLDPRYFTIGSEAKPYTPPKRTGKGF